MPGSSERVNYVLRPAKHVERKMLRDTFRRLSEFGPMESYRYVGFGAAYFSDFILFHKALGITDMIDIEADIPRRSRYQFNRPFRGIKMRFMSSGAALAELDWRKKIILWLDYDETLKQDDLADVATFCTSAVSGSVLVISVNVNPKWINGAGETILEKFTDRVGASNIALGTTAKNMTPAAFPETCRKIVTEVIESTLAARNGPLLALKQIYYQQLFNFRYRDGAPMLTVGGVFATEEHQSRIKACRFDLLPFLRLDRGSTNYYDIRVPNLTYRELHYLDAQLPLTGRRRLRGHSIPEEDLQAYAEIYKP